MANGHPSTHAKHDACSRSLDSPSSRVTSTSTHPLTTLPPSPNKAAPAHRTFFDPWNSSSTGHQRAENRLSGSTSWRASRSLKLSEQYRSGLSGGTRRVADTVGAGSADFGQDGRKANGGWERGAKGLRTRGQKSLVELWGAGKVNNKLSQESDMERAKLHSSEDAMYQHTNEDLEPPEEEDLDASAPLETHGKQLFSGLCIYINGSTAPLISDHKLKHMLASHGARYSIALGRRSVTHVLLGTTSARGGAGGGLAASKIQKEISKVGGKAVKFVTAEWVLESIKANRRLPESRFSPLKLTPSSQNGVFEVIRPGGICSEKRSPG